jgi:hypothetical protein
MRFSELCQLAECYGFQFARGRGSHRLYKKPGRRELMNFQDDGGKAKEYQVKQLLAVIEELAAQPPPDEEESNA